MQDKHGISEQLYAVLLYLYPKQFRAVYGRQMRLTFRDACRVAYHRNGVGGLLALWLPTLLDLLKSALEERARQGEFTMLKGPLMTLAGPLTISVGLLWIVASIGEFVLMTSLAGQTTWWDNFWFYPICLSFILMLPAFIGTWLRYQGVAGGIGRLGLILSLAGCMGMLVFGVASILVGLVAPATGEWSNYVIAVCFLSVMIGYILFGIDALRYKLLPRWNVTPLLVGLPTLLLIVPTLVITSAKPENTDFELLLTLGFLRFAVTGIFWVLMGMVMAGVRQGYEPAPAV